MLANIITTLQAYGGNCICLALFFICVIYAIVQRKNKDFHQIGITCLLLLLVLINPFVISFLVVHRFEAERIIKIYCLFPVYIVIAIVLADRIKGKLQLLITILVIALTGSFVITPTAYSKSNIYKLEQSAIDVGDFVVQDSDEHNLLPKVLVPFDLSCDIRLYAPALKQEVGRRVDFDYESIHQEELQQALYCNPIDSCYVETLACEDYCTYIVLEENKSLTEDFKLYEYASSINGYHIYRIIE